MSKKGPKLRGGDHKGSDRNKHTRSPGYRPGDNWLVCDICGCHVYSSDARLRWDGMVTCKQDWEPRHEQDFVRARKDRLVPAGLMRPEGEDDYTTIPGISGPDPIPPPPTTAYIFHDFSKEQLGGFTVDRPSYDTVIDYQDVEWAIGNHVPSLTGYQWDGVSKYTDVGLGIGIRTKPPKNELDGSYILGHGDALGLLPREGVKNNYCGQYTCRIERDFLYLQQASGWGWASLFSQLESRLTSDPGGAAESFSVFASGNGNPSSPGGALKTRITLGGSSEYLDSNEFKTAVEGDIIDVRWRKSDGAYGDNGFKVWHYLNGTLINTHTPVGDFTAEHAGEQGRFVVGSEEPRNYDKLPDPTSYADCTHQFVRWLPWTEDDATIEAWPTWIAPPGPDTQMPLGDVLTTPAGDSLTDPAGNYIVKE